MGVSQHFVIKDGELKPKEQVRSEPTAPYVHQDSMEPIESMASDTGEVFDSKSAYKRHLDEKGFEVTGGDHLTGRGVHDFEYQPDRAEINESVKEQINNLKWGNAPLTEKEKQLCRWEQRQLERYKKKRRAPMSRRKQLMMQRRRGC